MEFSRIGNASGNIGRSFDIAVVKIDQEGGGQEQFKNIDKSELKVIMQYFKTAQIKMRSIDPDTNKGVELNDLNSDDLDEEIR